MHRENCHMGMLEHTTEQLLKRTKMHMTYKMSYVELGKEPKADFRIIDHCAKAVYIQILEHLTTFL